MFNRDKTGTLTRLSNTIEELSAQVAELRGERQTLTLEQDLERLGREKMHLESELEKVREKRGQEQREIEHKLGLHRIQIESERTIMQKEAEAERLRAVEEAKLAVREGNLDAERKRFEEEIEFRT